MKTIYLSVPREIQIFLHSLSFFFFLFLRERSYNIFKKPLHVMWMLDFSIRKWFFQLSDYCEIYVVPQHDLFKFIAFTQLLERL